MRCPSCTTEVPEARFCARCGARLNASVVAGSSPALTTVTRRSSRSSPEHASTSRRGAAVAAGGLVAAVALGTVWAGTGQDPASDGVAVPAAADLAPADLAAPVPSPSPFVASPSATVLCSDLSEHRVKYAWLDDADLGDAVEVHGAPCIVTEIDADARPRDYPRGVARGNRPGTGPAPRR